MYTPAEGEFVSQDASLDEAIHQFVLGKHQSLLVIDNNKSPTTPIGRGLGKTPRRGHCCKES